MAGVGKRAPLWVPVSLLASPHGSLARFKAYTSVIYIEREKTDKTGLDRVGQGSRVSCRVVVSLKMSAPGDVNNYATW